MNTEVRYIYLGNMRRDIDRKKRERNIFREIWASPKRRDPTAHLK